MSGSERVDHNIKRLKMALTDRLVFANFALGKRSHNSINDDILGR